MDVPTSEFAVADAKARFSELLTRAENGESITIKRHGQAVAKIVPVTQNDMQRRRAAAADLLAWSKAQPVFPGKIDYKALINEGRKY
jgi:prevent-host-death family protein